MTICSISDPSAIGDVRDGKIIDLRALLARKHPVFEGSPVRSNLLTGLWNFDHGLEGGLPKAALTEVICPQPGMGSGTIIQALVASTQALGRHLALVDASDSFDPDGLTDSQLSALLWVRCAGPEQAVKATDLLCRDRNLSLVVLDLMMCSERQVRAIPSTYWYRLQRVARDNGAATLVFTPAAVVGSAACTLRLSRRFELPALDLLRDQLISGLQTVNVRTRSFAPFGSVAQPSRLVG